MDNNFTVCAMKSLSLKQGIDEEMPPELWVRRNVPAHHPKFHQLVYVRYWKRWNDYQLGYYPLGKNRVSWTETAYSFDQLVGYIRKSILNKAYQKPNKAIQIICRAPGDDVWNSMKCSYLPMEFHQVRDDYNCLSFSLASALFLLRDRHVCFALVDISTKLNEFGWKQQCHEVKEVYNNVFCEHKVYGLGEASVIIKKKKLEQIKKNLHKPEGKLLTIIVGDHSVTFYGLFIFNSQYTNAIFCSKENLKYMFTSDYQLTAAIKFEHNAAKLKNWLL